MEIIPDREHVIYQLLSGDEAPLVMQEGDCNIAAAAGNTWTSQGPVDAAILLCRECQARGGVLIGEDGDFSEVARGRADFMIRQCRR